MITRQEICTYLENLFSVCPHHDHSNNGLQVEGTEEIRKIAFAVDACQATFQEAATRQAQMLIVHHGISWGGGLARITDYHARRLNTLLTAGISLVGYHLPLDAHPEIGNNMVLASYFKLENPTPFFEYNGSAIGFYNELPQTSSPECLANILKNALGERSCLVLPAKENHGIKRIGIVSGGGAGAIEDCARLHIDCLITGEMLHQYVHVARELGVTVIAGGHYATETTGIQALQQKIAEHFDVPCDFIACPTGL